jgi:hypothetical protein
MIHWSRYWKEWVQQNIGLTDDECMELFRKDPALLGGKLVLAGEVLEWFKSSKGPGWSMDQVRRVFWKYPPLFNKSPDKMQETLDWVRNEYYDPAAGLAYIAQIPLFLQASLHGRVRPRYDLARQLGLHPGKVSLTNIYQSSDTAFAARAGIRSAPFASPSSRHFLPRPHRCRCSLSCGWSPCLCTVSKLCGDSRQKVQITTPRDVQKHGGVESSGWWMYLESSLLRLTTI